jgi:O-acetyl-ADP-ribose deacetylase (regulator of RNase III)
MPCTPKGFPLDIPNLHQRKGDLLEADVDVIVHQTNCISKGWSGLAYAIFTQHPEANTYLENPRPYMFGAWEMFKVDGAPYKVVANLYGQLYPGYASNHKDTVPLRYEAFCEALDGIMREVRRRGLTSIAFPENIGCGLAGGDWECYLSFIKAAAFNYPEIQVHIIGRD